MTLSEHRCDDFRVPQIGCGLVRIGRVWGTKEMRVPGEEETVMFLQKAWDSGVRIFDTASSYGKSEERLGKFLKRLSAAQRDDCFVATKCGEEYDRRTGLTRADHSLEGLEKSIRRSLGRLSRISLLQVHKATPELIEDKRVLRLLARYKKTTIPRMGVCATDRETAEHAIASNFFDFIQFPYNRDHAELRALFAKAAKAGKNILVSRPFASGALFDGIAPEGRDRETARISLVFVLKEMKWGGVVLVGTNNAEHLREDIRLFNEKN